MKKLLSTAAVLLLVVVCVCFAESRNSYEISITVSPRTLSLGSPGECLTVHTDIDFNDVVLDSTLMLYVPVTESEIVYNGVKSDLRGNLVAKFDRDAVKDAVEDQVGREVELILKGFDVDGNAFEGSDYIRVKK
ncbi:hypothetical protein ACFL02_03545 [Planctomycetota bacterium]